MRVPIICMDERLRQFVRAFRSCFSLPQYRYFVIVLLALIAWLVTRRPRRRIYS